MLKKLTTGPEGLDREQQQQHHPTAQHINKQLRR